MSRFSREDLIIAMMRVIENGDDSGEPWCLYEYNYHSPDPEWTRADAEIERSDFIEAVLRELK